jgi:hypothetical protein
MLQLLVIILNVIDIRARSETTVRATAAELANYEHAIPLCITFHQHSSVSSVFPVFIHSLCDNFANFQTFALEDPIPYKLSLITLQLLFLFCSLSLALFFKGRGGLGQCQ